jgi:hypothetical protein
MKKLIAFALFLGLIAGGLAFADPGPNGSNNHGLCTAYFNGSANGQAHKRNAPPFVVLAQQVGENNGVDDNGDGNVDEQGEMAGPEAIWDWCMDPDNNPKGIGGQPDDPHSPGEDPNGNSGGHGGGPNK